MYNFAPPFIQPRGACLVPAVCGQRNFKDMRAEGRGRQVHARAVLHVLAPLRRPRAASQGADTHQATQGLWNVSNEYVNVGMYIVSLGIMEFRHQVTTTNIRNLICIPDTSQVHN